MHKKTTSIVSNSEVKRIQSFKVIFKRIKGEISKEVIGLSDEVELVANIVSLHLQRQNSQTSLVAPRVLITGAVSSGKTHLITAAAKASGLPVSIISGGTLTPAGYRGCNITDGLFGLVSECKRDNAPFGILILDEVEKVVNRSQTDEFMRGVQYSLLPLFGGESVTVSDDSGMKQPITLSMKNVLIFAIGAFTNVNSNSWGSIYNASNALLRYGFEPELISRISHFIHLPKPTKQVTELIIRKKYKEILNLYGVAPHPKDDQLISKLAAKLFKNQFGVRFITSFLYDVSYWKQQKGRKSNFL